MKDKTLQTWEMQDRIFKQIAKILCQMGNYRTA